MLFKRITGAIVALALSAGAALAQGTMFPAGTVWGNDTASERPGKIATATAILDRAFGSTRGSILMRGAAGWQLLTPGTATQALISAGAGADLAYGVLGATGGGTGQSVYVVGDILQASTTTALSRLAGVATGNALISGGVGTVNSWGKITSAHMSITATNCTNQFVSAISTGGVGTCRSVAYADIATAALATSAELEAGTASKLLSAAIIYDGEVTITFAASQTLDFSTFLNSRITLTGNITTLTCSNIKASQSGAITLVQDGTGSRTMVAGWCSQFRWAGGVRGVLSTAINAIDTLFYQCISTTICYVSLSKAQAN